MDVDGLNDYVFKEVSNLGKELMFNATRNAINYGTNYIRKRMASGSSSKTPYKKGKYSSKGSGGVYTGKLVPVKSWGKSKFPKKPICTIHKEDVGTVQDVNVAFVGMGMNYENLWDMCVRNVVYLLLQKAGITITNWDNSLDATHFRIDMTYYLDPLATATTQGTASFLANASPNDIVSGLKSFMTTSFTTESVPKIKEFDLRDIRNAVSVKASHIVASGILNYVNCYQTVLIQNQTSGEGTVDNLLSTSILSNPLYIGVFDSNSNIVYEKTREEDDVKTWEPWVTYDDNYPEIYQRTAQNQFNVVPNQISDIFSNAKHTYRSVLQPGEMKKISLIHKYKGSLNYFLKMLYQIAKGDKVPRRVVPIKGCQRIIAFDKMLSQDISPVKVSYEMNQKTVCCYKYKGSKEILPIYQ